MINISDQYFPLTSILSDKFNIHIKVGIDQEKTFDMNIEPIQ